MESAYETLHKRHREIALLASAAGLLSWDQETGMPPKAAAFRAEQLAHLAGLTHRQSTDPELGRLLEAASEKSPPKGSVEEANLRGWKRAYAQSTKLPQAHVEEVERSRSQAMVAWREAREASDFSKFAPFLAKNFELARRTADYLGYKASPYDALADLYEEGATAATLAPILSELGASVATLLPSAQAWSRGLDRNTLAGHYPTEAQKRFNQRVAEAMGYDFSAGRIDTVTHPFCGTYGPSDTRITTRYHEDDFAVSFFGTLHELGHAVYEQGLPDAEYGQPAGSAAGLGIHESQSRTWENKVARSRPFWEHWFPIACDTFEALRKHDLDTFLRAINAAKPSHIRIEADELTYDLHIVLRFEIERDLVEGSLKVEDVPARWNERFHELTGLTVKNDAEGCLQDVHWSYGLIGYFPTYSLGNLASSQLFAKFEAEEPGHEAELRAGRADSLLRWMRDRIHKHGRVHTPEELMRQATGEATTARHHIAYLKRKYGA